MADKEFLLIQEGLNQCKEEPEFLKTTRRAEIAEEIKITRGFGDLSENAECDETKNKQAQVEERINYLKNLLLHAKVIQDDEDQKNVVIVRSAVAYKNLNLNEEMTYQVVGTVESDPSAGKISNESPAGKALLSLRVGDTTKAETPGGIAELKVLTVKKG